MLAVLARVLAHSHREDDARNARPISSENDFIILDLYPRRRSACPGLLYVAPSGLRSAGAMRAQ